MRPIRLSVFVAGLTAALLILSPQRIRAIDDFVNLSNAIATVSGPYTSAATSITVVDASKLAAPGANCSWWNDTDFQGNPSADPFVEIIRYVARTGNVLTIQRNAEVSGSTVTGAQNHNLANKTYRLNCTLTAKTLAEIKAAIAAMVDLSTPQSVTNKTFDATNSITPASFGSDSGNKIIASPADGSSGPYAKRSLDQRDFNAFKLNEQVITVGGTLPSSNAIYVVDCPVACAQVMPAATGNDGVTMSFRVARTSALVTLQRTGAESLGGKPTRILAAGEDLDLVARSGVWERKTYSSIRLRCVLYFTTTQAVAFNTDTAVTLNATAEDVGGMADPANNQCVIKRPGDYQIIGGIWTQTLSANAVVSAWGAKSTLRYGFSNVRGLSGVQGFVGVNGHVVSAAVNDTIKLFVRSTIAINLVQGATYGDSTGAPWLAVVEVPTW